MPLASRMQYSGKSNESSATRILFALSAGEMGLEGPIGARATVKAIRAYGGFAPLSWAKRRLPAFKWTERRKAGMPIVGRAAPRDLFVLDGRELEAAESDLGCLAVSH